VDNVGQEPHHMLHLEAKLLEMLPLFGLLPIIQKDIRFGRVGGGLNADPVGAPVLHLLVSTRLDAPDELLDGLERPPSSSTVFQVSVSLAPPPPDVPASSSSVGMWSSHDRRSRRNPGAIPSIP